MKTTQTTNYPAPLMKSIEDAKLNPPVNHFELADTLLKYALSDVNRAARHPQGVHGVTGTKLGNIEIVKPEVKGGNYKIVNFNNSTIEHFSGSKTEAVNFLASIFTLA